MSIESFGLLKIRCHEIDFSGYNVFTGLIRGFVRISTGWVQSFFKLEIFRGSGVLLRMGKLHLLLDLSWYKCTRSKEAPAQFKIGVGKLNNTMINGSTCLVKCLLEEAAERSNKNSVFRELVFHQTVL